MGKGLEGGLREVYRRETQMVDQDSGELLGTKVQVVRVPTRTDEDFAFVYRGGVEKVVGLSGAAVKTWLWCLVEAETGKGRVGIGSAQRQLMAKQFKCGASTVANALAELVEAGLLRRPGPGQYELQARAGWRGRVKGRSGVIERQHDDDTGRKPPGATKNSGK